MDSGEVGDEGEQSLQDLELDIHALADGVVHCVDDEPDGGLGDGFEGN